MSQKSKLILKIWLLLYLILTLLKIINLYNDTILTNLFSIGPFPLEISSIILFVYILDRGEEKIAKFGIYSVIIYFIFYVLYKFDVYSLGITKFVSMKDKLASIIYYTSNNCISICNYLALFSLISSKDDRVEKFKSVAIFALVGYTFINLINNMFFSTNVEFLRNINYILDYISLLAKYAVIILYLLSKETRNDNLSVQTNISQPISQSIQQNNFGQQISQPVQENVPQQQMVQPVQENVPQQQMAQPVQENVPQQQMAQPVQKNALEQLMSQPVNTVNNSQQQISQSNQQIAFEQQTSQSIQNLNSIHRM